MGSYAHLFLLYLKTPLIAQIIQGRQREDLLAVDWNAYGSTQSWPKLKYYPGTYA